MFFWCLFLPDKRGGHPSHHGNRPYNAGGDSQVPYQYHSKPRASYSGSGGQRWSEQRRERQEGGVKGEVSRFMCKQEQCAYLSVVSHNKLFVSLSYDSALSYSSSSSSPPSPTHTHTHIHTHTQSFPHRSPRRPRSNGIEKKKPTPVSLNHLLNFTVASHGRHSGGGSLPPRRRRRRGTHSYNKEQFLQAK